MGHRFFRNRLLHENPIPYTVTKEDIKNKCLEYVEKIFRKKERDPPDCEGGLYVGIQGIAYMAYYLAQNPEFSDRQKDFLERSNHFLEPGIQYAHHHDDKRDGSQVAFLLGGGGSYAVGAAVKHMLGDAAGSQKLIDEYIALADQCLGLDFLRCGSDEFFVGRAGYLAGALFLRKTFGREIVPEEKIFRICDVIIKSGVEYSKKVTSPCPLTYYYYRTQYLGAAHGMSSILQMLLSFPNYLKTNPKAAQLIQDSVDYILSIQMKNGNFPASMDEVNERRSDYNELVHWCHGAPGIVYLMARAYIVWQDQRYLDCCLRCSDLTWEKGLLKKGPGICHGIAGSGYVFLLLYRLTGDQKQLARAYSFAEFLSAPEFQQARKPDKPMSLYEGIAGTACFLADLLQPEKSHFPFFDVFL